MPRLSYRLVRNSVCLSLEELAVKLTDGKLACAPPTYHFIDGKIKRKEEYMLQCQVLGLDIDNKIVEKDKETGEKIEWMVDNPLTLEIALERCVKYQIPVAIAYSTFSSSTDWPRFRLVFVLNEPISDPIILKALAYSLENIFPEADPQCKDAPSRLFFPGKTILHMEPEAIIYPEIVVKGAIRAIRERDIDHASRNIERYCSYLSEKAPSLAPTMEDGRGGVGGGVTSGLEWEDRKPAISKTIAGFQPPQTHPLNLLSSLEGASHAAAHPVSIGRRTLERMDFHLAEARCRLLSEFITGNVGWDHGIIVGLASNLLNVRGGEKIFKEGVARLLGPKYDSYETNRRVEQLRQYRPTQCDKFCPYHETCNHQANIINTSKTRKGEVVLLGESRPILSRLEVEKQTETQITMALGKRDNEIYVIPSPTGIGKTEVALQNIEGVVYCACTHELAKEAASRLDRMGKDYMRTPELPDTLPTRIRNKIKHLHEIGCHSPAARIVTNLAKNGDKIAKDYLEKLDAALKYTGTIITTHERGIISQYPNHDVIVFDECPALALMKEGSCKISEIRILQTQLDRESVEYDKLTMLLNDIEMINIDVINQPVLFSDDEVLLIEDIAMSLNISTDVIGLLESYRYIKSEEDVIQYVVRRRLPEDKTIIILSATADIWMYEQMYGSRVHLLDIGQVEPQGSITQVLNVNFSRNKLDSDENMLELFYAIGYGNNIISYKKYKELLQQNGANFIGNFGGVQGLDRAKGLDIHILGTPHVPKQRYQLIAAALDLSPANYVMREREIEVNGARYRTMSFVDNDLIRIQQWLVRSELVQAVGRARANRTDAHVMVYSDVPILLPGTKYVEMTEGEKAEVLEKYAAARLLNTVSCLQASIPQMLNHTTQYQ